MSEREEQFEALIDRYLAGEMSAGERPAFEQRMEREGSLRAEVALQRRINDSIRRTHTPPGYWAGSFEQACAAREGAAGARGGRRSALRWAGGLAAAAVLALAAYIGWSTWGTGGGGGGTATQGPPIIVRSAADLDRLYDRHAIKSGFKPEEVCTTNEEFAGYTTRRFGEAIIFGPAPAGFAAIGWSYTQAISTNTSIVLVDAEGEKTLVLVDRLENDKAMPPAPESANLRLRRRELGDLVLYELAPKDAADSLAYFHEAPPDLGAPQD